MHSALRITIWAFIAATSFACGMGFYSSVELNGHVRRIDGTAVPGVRMLATWPDDPELGSMDTTTDADGRYRLFSMEAIDANWRRLLVTPSLVGHSFDPPSLDIFLAGEKQTADFTATETDVAMTWTEAIWWREPGGPALLLRVVRLSPAGQ